MATLQEYMNRRNAMSSSYDKYLQGTPRAKTKSFWQEEDVATALYRQRREMEERREASRRELEEQIRRAQQNNITPVKQGSDAGFLEKTGETVLDVFGNILSGASKALEGVFDLGISGVGAVAGIFDKGVRDEMRRWVEYDVTGQHVSANFDRWSDDSILNNSKAGQVTENVLRGVGQMLPTVLLSLATGGAAATVMLGASAAGNATEEAWNEGADYYSGLGYGLVTGGIEAGIEMATGGMAGLGAGYLDNILPSLATKTAATGVRRVRGNMAGEAAEEAVAELVNPLAKTIYKGRDALDDYSKAEYWQGVGESALVGGLTSAAYGGTVGRAMKASGKYGDVRETVDDIKANRQKRANLDAHDKWTDAREEAFHKREVANYRQIEKILQSATPKQRATMIKQNGLDGAFDADGSLTADFLRSLGENVVDGQTDTPGENAAQGAPTGATEQAAHNHQYMSPDLWRRTAEVDADLKAISERSGTQAKVFSDELSEGAKKNYRKTKKALNALNAAGGNGVSLVITEPSDTYKGGLVDGRTIYMPADQLESGDWAGTLVHEFTHFEEGTKEYSEMMDYLQSDDILVDDGKGSSTVLRDVAEQAVQGKGYGFDTEALRAIVDKADAGEQLTAEEAKALHAYTSEVTAHETEIMLGNEGFIDRIVRQNGSAAERLVGKLLSLDKAFSKMGDKQAKAQRDKIREAERLYLKAATAAGNGSIRKMILSQVPELEDEEVQLARKDGIGDIKQKQFDIIQSTNPMWDDYHVGIRSADDIRTWEEVLTLDDEREGQFVWGDFSREDAMQALEANSITVYSSYPIKNGTFVSTSYIQAREYAGGRPNSKVYSKTILLEHVAWINGDEGQYATDDTDVRFNLKESRDSNVDNYTEEDYNNYGWVRANDVLTAGQMKNFEARFAKVKSKQLKTYKSKQGEYMIPVSDIYDYESEGIENVIVYAKGEIDSPIVTRILEIDLDNETDLDRKRREIYAFERRGIQQTAGQLYRFHYPTDVGYQQYEQRKGAQTNRDNRQSGIQRGRSGETSSRIKGFHVNENGSTTYYRADGSEEVKFSLKEKADTTKQQTADDFSDLLATAGIEGEAAEIRGDLAELYRIANEADGDNDAFVGRVANRIAMEMARKGTPQNGETQDEMTERLRKEILARTDFAETEEASQAENGTEKPTSENEPKPKKTGYTYDDVNSMLDGIRKGGALDFETASGVINGQIFRNDRWDLGKRIYETLKMDELGSKRVLSRKIASMIVDTVKVNEKGADGKTVGKPLADVLGKDGIADAKEAIALDVAAALGDRDAKKYNKRMNDLKYAAEQLSNMKKGKYVNAANYKGNTFEKALSELARMNWRGGLVSAQKLRERFAALARWYTPSNPLYGSDGKSNERYRTDIVQALDFVSDTSRGAFTLEDIDAAEMIVKYFKIEIETYGTIFKNDKRIEAEPVVKRFISGIEQAKVIAERSSIVRGIFRNPLARLAADPAMLMREADGYLPGGFFSEQFEELRRGEIAAAVLEHEMLADFVAFWEKNKAYAKRYNDTEVKYGDKIIPLQEALSLYMTLKREHAFAGLAYAGFDIEGKKATVNASDGFADIVEKAKVELMNKLPPEKALTMTQKEIGEMQEKAIAQAVTQMREELYRQFTTEDKRLISIMERGYEACREVKIKIDMILKNDSNVVSGYYYPTRRTGLAESVDVMSMFEGDRVSNLSFNKDTVKNAHKLLIEPAHIVFMRHVKAMSLYDGLGVFTDNFNRLYNLNVGESANNAVTIRSKLSQSNNFVKDMMPYFKELKQDVEGISKKRSSERFYNDAVAMIRSAYATYQLGINPKTWASQLSSLIASTVKVDMDCLMRGFSMSGKDVDDYCKLAWLRNNDGDAVLAQSVTSGLNPVQMASRNALQKVRDVSMLPIGKVDRFVIEKLFAACQVQVEKQNKLRLGSKENKIEAGKLLERVILETQQNSLATERTAAMRSGDELLKGFNMFIADAMKVQARMIEPYARMSALRTQKRMARDAGNTAEQARLDKKIETARKECVRATSVLVGVALFNALLAYGFKWLYRRDEEEDVSTVAADMVGNMIGGIPFVRDAYTLLVDGFEADNFAISTFNDVLKTTADTAQLLQEAAQGKEITKQESMRAVRDVLYATGQLSGVPVRNLYNNVTGIVNRISPEAQYRMEDMFYRQSYSKDLQAAIEADDERMIALIASMMIEDKVGDVDKSLSDGLRPLVESGYDVLPRAVGDSIVYDGEEIVLTKRQKKRFKEVYAIAEEVIASMMKLTQYKEATDEVRARAIKLIWEAYYDLAVDDVLGVDSSEKNVLFAEAIDMDKLSLLIATARGIKADVGANGKAINGSRLAKIEAYVESLKLKAAQKFMVMGCLGYKNKNGEDKVRAYIDTLKALSKEEKQALLIYSGYAA